MARRPSDKATERRRARSGFTLVEMMVAVGILIVVIAGTAKIFGTVSKVTGIGIAGADVLQEAAAIERQLRADFQRLTPEGYFAIRCVAVPNDFQGGRLLNPSLRPDALIRADQLVFFTTGVQSIQTFRQGAGSDHKGQATAARVYYGHAFQLPAAQGVDTTPSDHVKAHDPVFDPDEPLVPWYEGPTGMVRTVFRPTIDTAVPDYSTTNDDPVDATQPPARRWLLARQSIALADDGGSPAVYLRPFFQYAGNRSAPFIHDLDQPVIRNGRVDAAAEELHEIRRLLTTAFVGGNLVGRPWLDPMFVGDDQRAIIAGRVFYPRAERVAPSMHRVDQALTAHVLATACSSFLIDWTYENGVGEVFNAAGTGVQVDPTLEHPWFGMPDAEQFLINGDIRPDFRRAVGAYGDPDYETLAGYAPADTIVPISQIPNNVEGLYLLGPDVVVYEAFFGFNRDKPLDPATGRPWSTAPSMVAYTPWPTAIRITMTLHDTETRLETGRVVQFVIDLPKRVE